MSQIYQTKGSTKSNYSDSGLSDFENISTDSEDNTNYVEKEEEFTREKSPTPDILPRQDGTIILNKEDAELFHQLIKQFKAQTLDQPSTTFTASHNTNAIKISKFLDANTHEISTDSKDFGMKFIALCIASAFGGRKGFERYQIKLPRDNFNFASMLKKLRGCINQQGGLNITICCYVGHVVIYYWNHENVRKALIRKYGDGLMKVIGGNENIKKEIGGLNLWTPNKRRVSSKRKRDIIENIAERKFQFDENIMKVVMDKLGIDVE